MKEVKDTKYIPEDKKEISALFSGVRVSFSRIETLVTNEQLKEKFIELEHTLNNNTMTLREQVKKTMDLLVPFCKELNIKYNETLVEKFFGTERERSVYHQRVALSNNRRKSNGRPRILSDNQIKELENFIKLYHNIGIPPTSTDLQWFFRTKFEKNLTKRQVMNICKKCPNIKTSKAEVIESDRCFLSVDQVKKYCTEAKEKLRGVRASFVFNLDEVGFSIYADTRIQTVCVYKGLCKRPTIPAFRDDQHLSLLVCISADGTSVKPMMCTKRASLGMSLIGEMMPFCNFAYQCNGYMNGDLFIRWLNETFVPEVKERRSKYNYTGKAYLIMDGFSGHTSQEVMDILKKNKIEIVQLAAHSSHITQPLDLCMFNCLKSDVYTNNEIYYSFREEEIAQITSTSGESDVFNFEDTTYKNSMKRFLKCTVEERIKIIIHSYNRVCNIDKVKSSFMRSGIITKTEWMSEREAKTFGKTKVQDNFAASDLVENKVYFNESHSQTISEFIGIQYVPYKPDINSDKVNIIRYDERQKRKEIKKNKLEKKPRKSKA